MRPILPLWLWIVFVALLLVGVGGGVERYIQAAQAQTTIMSAPGQPLTVWVPTQRTAVDLAFVVERDDAGEVTKIHRFILWSNGDVSFPNIPYYARLVFSCRDCPKVEPACPGDIDGDGVVGAPDLLIVTAAWGNCP